MSDLQAEQSDAAGAVDENRLASAQTAALDQGEPGGKPGAGQRARLRIVEARRRARQPILGQRQVFGQNPPSD
jgi:hypothetical protein